MKFHIVEGDDERVHVKSVGPIAPDAPELLAEKLVDLVGPDMYRRRMRLNLEDSEFITSAGIGGLLHCHKRFAEHGGELSLASPSRAVRQTFDLMRLGTVFRIE